MNTLKKLLLLVVNAQVCFFFVFLFLLFKIPSKSKFSIQQNNVLPSSNVNKRRRKLKVPIPSIAHFQVNELFLNSKSMFSFFLITTSLVLITSYDIVMRDRFFLEQHEWRFLVVDEAHRLKSFNCMKIVSFSDYCVILFGFICEALLLFYCETFIKKCSHWLLCF